MKTMVRFRTAQGTCLIAAEQVLEVRSAQGVRTFPGPRDDIVGLVERQGRALTVMSTLGAGGGQVLLLATTGGAFGLLVDEVYGIAKVEESDLGPAPAGQSRPLVEAVVNTRTGLELVISTDELWHQLGAREGSSTPPAGRLGDELPLHVLLVEDNVVVQVMTRRLLGKLGYTIEVAANGKEAIAAMERTGYDIVFMDLQMPEMDGLAAVREIVRRWPSDHPPVIAMTGADSDSERQASLAAGMSDYLCKPVRQADLGAVLRRWGSMKRTPARAKTEGS